MAQRELDEWLGVDLPLIVHDLKSPIAAIALEMYMLMETAGGTRRDAFHEVASRVLRNIEFVDRLVQDLLDHATLDAGHFEFARTRADLRTLVRGVVDRVVTSPDRARVVIEGTHTCTVAVNELCIERVLANLIANALKYAPPPSQVSVRIDLLPTSARVAVIDQGPGIAPDEITYIFERYRRAPGARAHDGSGLGLYVSRQMIEAHGGRLAVASSVGEGACFYFELPFD